MCVLSRFLIVHGGIENTNETKNNLFYYDIESCDWVVPSQQAMPYLSHHAMAVVPVKGKRKVQPLEEML